MNKITKETTIGEAIKMNPGIVPILMSAGLHCMGCPSAQGETLEEAAMVHGLDPDEFLSDINDFIVSTS